jgi:hypothetical protein
MISVVAGAVTISGATLVGVPGAALPSGLTAQTVARYLADAVPPDVRDVRVNGVYGSAHGGTWQFVAHMTWRGADGAVHGGSTELPQNGGQALVPTEFTQSQLDREERMGWTIDQLEHALRDVDVDGAALAMVDLEITAAHGARLVACSAPAADAPARCAEYDASGDLRRHFTDQLLDEPALNGISVQRASAPVTAP